MLGGMRGSLHESCTAQAGVHMHNMVANEWSVYDASLEIMRALVAALSGETRNLQGTACNMQRAACNMQHAACNVPHATCNVPHATCRMQHATCAGRHALRYSALDGRRADTVRRSASHCTE